MHQIILFVDNKLPKQTNKKICTPLSIHSSIIFKVTFNFLPALLLASKRFILENKWQTALKKELAGTKDLYLSFLIMSEVSMLQGKSDRPLCVSEHRDFMEKLISQVVSRYTKKLASHSENELSHLQQLLMPNISKQI